MNKNLIFPPKKKEKSCARLFIESMKMRVSLKREFIEHNKAFPFFFNAKVKKLKRKRKEG